MVEELEPEEVARRLAAGPKGTIVLLDVREDWEREVSKIEPSLHVPMSSIPDHLPEIPKDRLVVVYCHHGTRSEMVAGYLERNGFDRIANLSGGIDAWSTSVDPRVPRYG